MPDPAEPFIRIRGLTHGFGDNHVLRGVDLDIFRSETIALLGGSGGGGITVDGVEISRLGER